MYISHISDNGQEQSVIDHLNCTASIAEQFAKAFGASEYARCISIMHDIGKYSAEFQRRIRGDSAQVDHATAGAQELVKAWCNNWMAICLAYCIAGHHAGLPDGGLSKDNKDSPTLRGRLNKNVPDYSAYRDEVDVMAYIAAIKSLPITPLDKKQGYTLSFFIRMLFSCLKDADYLDTEAFVSGGAVQRGNYDDIDTLCDKLERHISEKGFDKPSSEINSRRYRILHSCERNAECERGLFTLTVPTGGGKTIASMAFALRHAKRNGMARVICVLPYTSIIEQNAAVYRDIFGDNVIEHHANYNYDDNDHKSERHRLATENWDAPIIVTTNVQFFESLYANKSSGTRKLHNIANSVIIFDEAQMLPREHLLPCTRAIVELTHNYNCTAVLCTATQPSLGPHLYGKSAAELCDDAYDHYLYFKRAQIKYAGIMSDDMLAERIGGEKQSLCIVNNKRHARELYKLIDGGAYHLSTLMYPIHRKATLKAIREALIAGQPCRVIATNLVEAGVDLDFPTVYREKAGVDSIIQAAGRCNREGKRPLAESNVYVFDSDSRLKPPDEVLANIGATEDVMYKYADVSEPDAIRSYFDILYYTRGDMLDSKHIVAAFDDGAKEGHELNFPFATVAESFRIINEDTRSILIPIANEAADIAAQLRGGIRTRELLRKAGMYSVSVYNHDFIKLYDAGAVERLDENIAILIDVDLYRDDVGLEVYAAAGQAFII